MYNNYMGYAQPPLQQYYDRYNSYNHMPNIQNPPQIQQGGIIRVNGENGAKAFSMPPNSSAILMDENKNVFYLKSTDGAGYPTLDAYEFKPVQNEPPTPSEDYVTRAEFEELKGMIVNEQHTKQNFRNGNAEQSKLTDGKTVR